MTHSSRVVINKGLPVPRFTSPPDSFIRVKLNASKRRVGNLVLFNLLICPFLCGIVILTIWGDARNEKLTFPNDILEILGNINLYIILGFLVLWMVAHILEILLLLALATDNLRFCKAYLGTIAPPLWVLILVTFGFAMWSGLQPAENNELAKFMIITAATLVLVANFFSYHLKALAEHINFMSIFMLITDRTPLIEYI